MSAVVLSAIKHAWPDSRAKHIANGLGCSVITGKRIASTGKVSSRFRTALNDLLDVALAKNLAAIQHHLAVLKADDNAKMVSRAADRRTAADRQAAGKNTGLGDRTGSTRPVSRDVRGGR
jgi:hypothetical protein